MPKLINKQHGSDVQLNFNLIKNNSFIYNREEEEYLNWLPVELSLLVGENLYTFEWTPTFSLEALRKYFIPTLEALLKENEELQSSFFEAERKVYNCGATEGEFWLKLTNSSFEVEKELIFIEFWMNGACINTDGSGYDIGISFTVINQQLLEFVEELKQQVYELTDGDVDMRAL